MSQAFFVLDDGRIFQGQSWAATGKTFGEAVFQTGMTGYQETLTDPSYHKQVVVMTAPHIGNTGVNTFDNEPADDLGIVDAAPCTIFPPTPAVSKLTISINK